jgi:hypothetical protein
MSDHTEWCFDCEDDPCCCDRCELCDKRLLASRDVICYPKGHHGEPVQCLSCYSGGLDAGYEGGR